jgi:hypothetical protein
MLLPPFDLARVIAAAVVAACLFFAGMATHKLFSDRKIARLQAAQAATLLEWQAQAAQAERQARAHEAALQAAVDSARQEANDAAQAAARDAAELARANAALVVVHADAGRLRRDLAAYAGGPGRADADSLAACRARAERLATALADGGELLGESTVLVAEGAELVRAAALDADRRRAKLIACVKGWPQ